MECWFSDWTKTFNFRICCIIQLDSQTFYEKFYKVPP